LQGIASFLRQNLLGAVALLVALTGVSYAVAASHRAKTLEVCQLKHSRNLVVTGKGVKCAGAKIRIGAPGPAGPAGPQGDPGTKGDTGGPGVLNVTYNTAGDGVPVSIPPDPDFGTDSATPVTIVSVHLPAGSYWITGKLLAQSTAPPDAFRVDCDVVAGRTRSTS
jgi:hypothetical protein